MRRNQKTDAMVERARDTCEIMGGVLQGTLQRLTTAPPETAGEARDLIGLIVAYQKALQSVLDFEKNLERQADGDQGGDIDLDAARREVLGKLARLADRG